MGTETEIKLRVTDGDAFLRNLMRLQPALVAPRHFEDNHVLDYPDARLRSRGCLLRVRRTAGGCCLTYKGPAQAGGKFKVREETELTVSNGDALLSILEMLGLMIWFRYQKYRREYIVPVPGASGEDIHVTYDETPVGDFAELEGSKEGICRVASELGFDDSQFIRESYFGIYAHVCRERGETPGHMIFPEQDSPASPRA